MNHVLLRATASSEIRSSHVRLVTVEMQMSRTPSSPSSRRRLFVCRESMPLIVLASRSPLGNSGFVPLLEAICDLFPPSNQVTPRRSSIAGPTCVFPENMDPGDRGSPKSRSDSLLLASLIVAHVLHGVVTLAGCPRSDLIHVYYACLHVRCQ